MEAKKRPADHEYQNPVYPYTCPDPFVLKYLGQYWCYSTGFAEDGGVFPILRSDDLVHWQKAGSAMPPIPGDHPHYWAPEVDYFNGTFYLYYSVGDGTEMHIRVATAVNPQGPFTDSGRRVTQEEFAIDGHVFIDDDGRRYFFYATDFLDVPRVGTGTVVDAMIDPYTLAGSPRPVTLAKYDWQIFDPKRAEKGGLRWHTIEGSYVLKHQGRYYQMFSGGNWQNSSYGVAYAVADHIDQNHEWLQTVDGEKTLPILRSIPENGIIGPGHNSVVRGPDNRELFIVYHRWRSEVNNRIMAIDRMVWEGGRMVVHGPTSRPQPMPNPPNVFGFQNFQLGHLDVQQDSDDWLTLTAVETGQSARCDLPEQFIIEVSFRALCVEPSGSIEVALGSSDGTVDSIRFQVDTGGKVIGYHNNNEFRLPEGFDLTVFHLIRIETDGARVHWRLDGIPAASTDANDLHTPKTIQIQCRRCSSEWAAFTLTKINGS